MNIDNCLSYELIESKEIGELKSKGYYLKHKKSGARILVLENDDENKVFSIGFRTPPTNSKGMAHIVEHTVLCGSREFPVKDPFGELAKGSLNTFLNAMTYPDKTVYPIASCNDKDFQNLMHVYLDAVFFPNIYKDKRIFLQEGWRYEMDDPEGDIRYNGVVFNEMKGVFSSPDEILSRIVMHSLFPDTQYGVESGGDPVDIPDLSYEEYLDFHRSYYHPSNSYIYLYGDMDIAEKLNWIDEKYLGKFDRLEVDSSIRIQETFDKMREEKGYFSATEGEDIKDKAYISYNFVCKDSRNKNLCSAMEILNQVLINALGAPVKQDLLDAGLGTEIESYFNDGISQTYMSIVSKNIAPEKKNLFMETLRESLKKQIKNGINEKSLRAAISKAEFSHREGDFGSYPKGLMYVLQAFDSWLYEEDKPFLWLEKNETFEFLKKQIGTGYFENLVEEYFLNNSHSSLVVIEPKIGMTQEMDLEEKKKLNTYKASLSMEEKQALVKETKELKKYQEEPDSPEDLKCIPVLEISDIKKEVEPSYNDIKEVIGKKIYHHNLFTNGINYLSVNFDVTDLKEYIPYIALLAELLAYMDTDKYDKLELGNEILLHSGNLGTNVEGYKRIDNGKSSIYLTVSSKVLYSETSNIIELILEIIKNTHFEDSKRIKEILAELRSILIESMLASGHITAVTRAKSYMSDYFFIEDNVKGIGFYDFICDLDDNFEERKDNLIGVLKSLAKKIFVKERLMFSLTADDEGYSYFEKALEKIDENLEEKDDSSLVEQYWKLEKWGKNEGFKTASKVQYVARVGEYNSKNIERDGSYKVVKKVLGMDFLWNEIRVKGGAYGVMCQFNMDGVGQMTSYRDPNLSKTNQAYENIPKYLENFDVDDREMSKYIIGTIGILDTPVSTRIKGSRSMTYYLMGITDEMRQKDRDQVLSTNQEKIRKAAKMVEAVLDSGYICVIGGEEKIENDKELFEKIRVLK